MPKFYPEEALEAHGLTPDDWNAPGCYALDLDVPHSPRVFRDNWADHYQVDPEPNLLTAVANNQQVVYVGATANLRERLADHVTGDRRPSALLAVCPPTDVVGVWSEDSAALAFERERQHAYEYRDGHDGVVCWCDGEVV